MYRVLCTIGSVCCVVVLVAGLQGSAQASVLFATSGTADPVSNGLTLFSQTVPEDGPNAALQYAGTDGLGWTMDTVSVSGHTAYNRYNYTIGATDLSDMGKYGWTSTVRTQVLYAPTANWWYNQFTVHTASRQYELYLGADASGTPWLKGYEAGAISGDYLAGLNLAPGYHTYTMSAAAGSPTSIDVQVDGIHRATFSGDTSLGNPGLVVFGTGSANAQQIEFTTWSLTAAPEPATLTMLVTGMIGLLAYAWRRRK
jgi:hypothetical protein